MHASPWPAWRRLNYQRAESVRRLLAASWVWLDGCSPADSLTRRGTLRGRRSSGLAAADSLCV